jgi:hypothetical protein
MLVNAADDLVLLLLLEGKEEEEGSQSREQEEGVGWQHSQSQHSTLVLAASWCYQQLAACMEGLSSLEGPWQPKRYITPTVIPSSSLHLESGEEGERQK